MKRLRLAWKMALYALRHERIVFMVFRPAPDGEEWLQGYYGRGLSEGLVRMASIEACRILGESRRVG